MIENTTRSELEQPDNQSFYIKDPGRKALEDRLKEVLGEDRQAILKDHMPVHQEGVKSALGDVKISETSPYAIHGTIAPATIVPPCPETVTKKPMNPNHEKLNPEKSVITEDEKIEEKKIVEKMNKTIAFMHKDQSYILTEKVDLETGGTTFSLESEHSFKCFYRNKTMTYKSGKTRSWADIFICHNDRRQFEDLTFNPNTVGHVSYEKPDGTTTYAYNLWRGFAVKEAPGSCELYKGHVRNIICNGNEKHFDYVWGLMAHIIQRPDKFTPALALRSDEGAGKGVFVCPFSKILGLHFKMLKNINELVGRFNGHLMHSVLTYCNEVEWNNKDNTAYGVFKSIVTEKTLSIEQKGKDIFTVPNFNHLILSSNRETVVPISAGDRRVFFLDVSNSKIGNKEYFDSIYDELETGGYEALLYELKHYDLSKFDPQNPPHNIDLFYQKLQTGSSILRYVYDRLCEGSFDPKTSNWEDHIYSTLVYESYRTWCISHGEEPIIYSTFGVEFKKLTSVEKGKVREGNKFPNKYCFLGLIETRKHFQKVMKEVGDIW